MSFSDRAKTIALAIVKIFETGKPFGDYSVAVVLNDGAGISYGISQFTHRSGSLSAVLARFTQLGGNLPDVVVAALPDFKSGAHIPKRSADNSLKAALRRLGKLPVMQQAQREIAFEKYLKPAIDACEGSGFVLPLSLAVIYDSMNHGSWSRIRDRVTSSDDNEKAWITEYVRKRDAWLESVPRLAVTDYRTDFFLAQIARGNWNLDLPLNVHGFKLTEAVLFPEGATGAEIDSAVIAPVSDEPEILPSGSTVANQTDKPPEGEVPPTSAESEPVVVQEKTTVWQRLSGWTEKLNIVSGFRSSLPEIPKISLSSWLTFVGTKGIGWLLMPLGFLWANPLMSICGLVLIVGAIWYFSHSKDRATARITPPVQAQEQKVVVQK